MLSRSTFLGSSFGLVSCHSISVRVADQTSQCAVLVPSKGPPEAGSRERSLGWELGVQVTLPSVVLNGLRDLQQICYPPDLPRRRSCNLSELSQHLNLFIASFQTRQIHTLPPAYNLPVPLNLCSVCLKHNRGAWRQMGQDRYT